jgi:hypothetical protein
MKVMQLLFTLTLRFEFVALAIRPPSCRRTTPSNPQIHTPPALRGADVC